MDLQQTVGEVRIETFEEGRQQEGIVRSHADRFVARPVIRARATGAR
jgi:hypothetical protein